MNKRLLRPLHRQRQRRRSRVEVLNGAELAERFAVSVDDIEDYLQAAGIPYHGDGNGQVWASVPKEEEREAVKKPE